MKAKFTVNEVVLTKLASGTVQQVCPFPDHIEYLIQWPDRTANWVHEDNLLPTAATAALKPSLTPQ